MPWRAMRFDELPPEEREAYLSRRPILEARIKVYGDKLDEVSASFSVPEDSRLRSMASAEPLENLVRDIAESIRSAVATAFRTLVVETEQLASSGPAREDQPAAALDVEVLLGDLGPDKAEVRLVMPDPLPFRRAIAAGQSLAAIGRSTTATVDREVRKLLRTEIVDRGLLSR